MMGKTEMVRSSTTKVSGIPTNVFTIGADIHDRPNEVILVIPGKTLLIDVHLTFTNTNMLTRTLSFEQ